MKKLFQDALQKLGIFFLLNIAVILVYVLVWILFKIPVIGELTYRFIDIAALDAVLYLLYAISYYVFIALLIFRNSSARAAYLNATADEKYSFKREVLDYFRENFASDIIASTALSAISFLLLGVFSTNKFLRLVFLAQYSISHFVGVIGGALFYAIFTALFTFALTALAQMAWNKGRLGGNTENK